MKTLIAIILGLTLSSCCYLKDEMTEEQVQRAQADCEYGYDVEYCGPIMPHIFGSITDIYCKK